MSLELRATIKEWERQFLGSKGHKPTPAEIKADKKMYKLYKQYQASKLKSKQTPETPQKPKTDSNDPATNTFEDLITEVFPTPQVRGKVLGLFDMELTPVKPPTFDAHTPETPSNQLGSETPLNKKTPDYLFHRIDLFSTKSDDIDSENIQESPLFKRAPLRKKSVSELVKEASELQKLSFDVDQAEANDDFSNEQLNTRTPNDPPNNPTTQLPNTTIEGDNQQIPTNSSTEPVEHQNALPSQPARRTFQRKPKRQTKKVTMRPVTNESRVSKAKATDNFVRLKINHNPNKRQFRRRWVDPT